jgi:hypothetical protein
MRVSDQIIGYLPGYRGFNKVNLKKKKKEKTKRFLF